MLAAGIKHCRSWKRRFKFAFGDLHYDHDPALGSPELNEIMRNSHRQRLVLNSILRMVAAAIALGAVGCKNPPRPSSSAAIPQVLVARVNQKDVPIFTESVGTTEGFVNAKILPKISGYLLKQDYRDGSHVNANQLLFEIDDRPYRASLGQALGNLAQVQAQLKQNQQDLAKYTALYKAQVISKQQFQTSTQTTRATAAQVQAAQAAVESAKLNLGWTKVYSPIDGVSAIAQAQVGDLVSNTTLLTTVSQLNPIKVSFPISEKDYLRFADRINARENGTPKDSGVRFELILDNGRVYSQPGRFYAANRQVDAQTGTIQIQATFPNAEDLLRPGMYAKIRAQTGVRHDALLVPQSAIFEIQGQYEIAIVGDDNRVALRSVTPGKKVGALSLVDAGVKAGELVVVEGVQKMKDGLEVKPVLAPEPSPTALPETTPAGAASIGANPAQEE
jgi:membrane fusion protein (multidrug efflux system)